MQGKVSIVMPCYNKVQYISEMFDSIISQNWNNIELILVNDGSTDGTREIIAEYEPLFHNRGYEIVIVDQENAGVCKAAKVGLDKVTGNYVCCVDSDDELDSEYVSTMAYWLEQHTEYDFCMCAPKHYSGIGKNKKYDYYDFKIPAPDTDTMLKQWILSVIDTCIWPYLVRYDYFKKCKIVENYSTDSKWSHEPSFMTRLLAHGGKCKYFTKSLYGFNIGNETSHSRSNSKDYMYSYRENYTTLTLSAIDKLDCYDEKTILLLKTLIEFERRDQELKIFEKYSDIDRFKKMFDLFEPSELLIQLIDRAILFGRQRLLVAAVKDYLTGGAKYHRIIACGVFGKDAAWYLPSILDTQLELWDNRGNGISVKHPDYTSLIDEDLIVLFPTSEKTLAEITSQINHAEILNNADIKRKHRLVFYPELYLNINKSDIKPKLVL